jgi:hypothetical protein
MTAPARQRSLFVFTAALVFGLAWACGRNEIDNPVDPLPSIGTGGAGFPNGTGGTGLTGIGGFFTGIGGSFTGAGGTGPAAIPCGSTQCVPSVQVCCGPSTGGGSPMCASAGNPNPCGGGLTVGCVNSSNCSSGNVCCLSLGTLSTTCQQPLQCAVGGNVAICSHNFECATPPNLCCPVGALPGGYCVPPGGSCPVPNGLP